jgi:hypothetical protein
MQKSTLQEPRLAGRQASAPDPAGQSHRPGKEPVNEMEPSNCSSDEEMSDAVADWDCDIE